MLDFNFLIPILVVLTLSWTVYLIFELFVRRKERILFIEKMHEVQHVDSANLQKLLPTRYGCPSFSFSGLRLGMLLLGIGLGVMVAFLVLYVFIGQNYIDDPFRYDSLGSVVYVACVCFFGGTALVGSYYVEKEYKKYYKHEDKK